MNGLINNELGVLNLKGNHYAQVFMDVDATNAHHRLSSNII